MKAIVKQCNYVWRLIATAFSFIIFGLGGFLLWLIVFPLLNLISTNKQTRIIRSQRYIQAIFYLFIGLMHRLGIMSYDIKGLEKLNRPGQLIIANHPTLIDIVFLISRMPATYCIVKDKLLNNPFTKASILNAGYISNADPQQMIEESVIKLQTGGKVIIFPEGSRTVQGQPYKFQRSAAHIALQANTCLTPVTINCFPNTLSKQQKWYQIPHQAFHLSIQVGNDIVLDDFLTIEPRSIAVRRLNRYLESYFSQQRECNS